MGIREAAYACGLVQPRLFLPMHYGTFANQQMDVERLAAEVSVRAPKTTVARWVPGGRVEY
jgi:L-ascorbate metabolism protein UlaG (beta-lactamase superfamily)